MVNLQNTIQNGAAIKAIMELYAGKTILVVLIVCIVFFLVNIINKIATKFDKKIEKALEADPKKRIQVSELKITATNYRFFKRFLNGLIYFIGFGLILSVFPQLRNIAYSILAGSGIVSILLGLASRETFGNIIGGLLIDVFRPFEIGNHIKIGKDTEGIVKDITLHHTILKTEQNNHIMIPNSIINNQSIENITWLAEEVQIPLDIYISYNADLNAAIEHMQSILNNNLLILDKRTEEEKLDGKLPVIVNVEKLNLGNIQLRAWFWARNEKDAYQISCDSYKLIKNIFDKNKISFPNMANAILGKENIL